MWNVKCDRVVVVGRMVGVKGIYIYREGSESWNNMDLTPMSCGVAKRPNQLNFMVDYTL